VSWEQDRIRLLFAAIRDLQVRVTRLEQLDPQPAKAADPEQESLE
jgi:hypothetical protein